ncbi:hypothetical protein AALB16_09145 [Lachnospiraceae bacterium 62-35]
MNTKPLERVQGLTQKFDKEFADSVLEVSIRANKQIAGELRGDDGMCQALLEILQTEIDKTRADETRRLILRSIKSFRDLSIDDEQIKRMLVKNYELTSEEAEVYL